MTVNELINDLIPPVKSSDAAGTALEWMEEFKLSQLPVVDEGTYKGLVTEANVLDASSLEMPISELQFLGWETACVHEGKHVYEAIKMMSSLRLELLPVLDEAEKYLGVVTLKGLLTALERIFSMQEAGGIVELRIPDRGYALSEISRIAESENAKILSLYISRARNNKDFLLTLKLNIEDLSRVIASFERFGYEVERTYFNAMQLSDYQRNLDALMNFLDT